MNRYIPSNNLQQSQGNVFFLERTASDGNEDWNQTFNCKLARRLSIAHILIGLLGFITQLVLVTSSSHWSLVESVYVGVVFGILFAVTGGIGLFASLKPGKWIVCTYMILSIISNILSILLLLASFGSVNSTGQYCMKVYGQPDKYEQNITHIGITQEHQQDFTNHLCGTHPLLTVIFILMMTVVAIAEGVVSFMSSIVCGETICSCRNRNNINQDQAVYGTVMYVGHPTSSRKRYVTLPPIPEVGEYNLPCDVISETNLSPDIQSQIYASPMEVNEN